jgi:hypothetical protein
MEMTRPVVAGQHSTSAGVGASVAAWMS